MSQIIKFERSKRLKLAITFGMVAPSVARLVAPDWPELQNLANVAMLVTGLVWLWEM